MHLCLFCSPPVHVFIKGFFVFVFAVSAIFLSSTTKWVLSLECIYASILKCTHHIVKAASQTRLEMTRQPHYTATCSVSQRTPSVPLRMAQNKLHSPAQYSDLHFHWERFSA